MSALQFQICCVFLVCLVEGMAPASVVGRGENMRNSVVSVFPSIQSERDDVQLASGSLCCSFLVTLHVIINPIVLQGDGRSGGPLSFQNLQTLNLDFITPWNLKGWGEIYGFASVAGPLLDNCGLCLRLLLFGLWELLFQVFGGRFLEAF